MSHHTPMASGIPNVAAAIWRKERALPAVNSAGTGTNIAIPRPNIEPATRKPAKIRIDMRAHGRRRKSPTAVQTPIPPNVAYIATPPITNCAPVDGSGGVNPINRPATTLNASSSMIVLPRIATIAAAITPTGLVMLIMYFFIDFLGVPSIFDAGSHGRVLLPLGPPLDHHRTRRHAAADGRGSTDSPSRSGARRLAAASLGGSAPHCLRPGLVVDVRPAHVSRLDLRGLSADSCPGLLTLHDGSGCPAGADRGCAGRSCCALRQPAPLVLRILSRGGGRERRQGSGDQSRLAEHDEPRLSCLLGGDSVVCNRRS